MQPRTLAELLVDRSEQQPNALYVRFLDRGREPLCLTYADTLRLATSWATIFIDAGLEQGKAVALCLPTCEDFVGAFFGALLAGAIPTAQDSLRSPNQDLGRLTKNMSFTGARHLVVPPKFESINGRLDAKILTRNNLCSSEESISPPIDGTTIAINQFTSGTSGRPKVVQLSHAAVLSQLQGIAIKLELDEEGDSAVSWLPLSHDMGLIGFLLAPALVRRHVSLIPTEDFVAAPLMWIKALSDYRATITGGPPSAYALCGRFARQADVDGIDLSALRIALVGAEQISRDSLEIFSRRFAGNGLDPRALMPTYGLAENCLAVTMPVVDEPPRFDRIDLNSMRSERRAEPAEPGRPSRSFACVGTVLPNVEVRIVDEHGGVLAERRIGEIVIRGSSLMSGYAGQAEPLETTDREDWLATGDLGYLNEGELFVTGRKKELIIVGGRNFHPEDLETAACTVRGVRSGRVVAFSINDAELSTERVIVAVESGLENPEDRVALRQQVTEALVTARLPIDRVLLLARRSIRRTGTGKTMRIDCRNRYLEGRLVELV
ncbi:MAG: AMP-binding protein [Thermoanaerobaculales bacterium]|nr:AMP-binding protein [Thermoanaerobaculales bacterium]